MVKLIIFSVIVFVFISSFSLDLTFFTNGFNVFVRNITSYSFYFFNFFKTIFNTLFSSPIISIFLGVGFVTFVVTLFLSSIGGSKHE